MRAKLTKAGCNRPGRLDSIDKARERAAVGGGSEMTMAQPDPAAAAAQWLAQFEKALAAADESLLRALFDADSHWRDVLALTWRIGTVSGQDAVARALATGSDRAPPAGFAVDPERTPPRRVTRAGVETVEAIFRFETVDGRGAGVVRLTG